LTNNYRWEKLLFKRFINPTIIVAEIIAGGGHRFTNHACQDREEPPQNHNQSAFFFNGTFFLVGTGIEKSLS